MHRPQRFSTATALAVLMVCSEGQAQCDPAEVLHVWSGDGGPEEWFGVGVDTDGLTAVVGCPNEDGPAGAAAGAAHIFERGGGAWTPKSKLFAPDGAGYDSFGRSVAVSDQTIVVGAPRDNTGAVDAGSVHVFDLDSGAWSKLFLPVPHNFDYFGTAVAVDADTIVAGAPNYNVDGNSSAGSAGIFVRQGNTWTRQALLTASDSPDLIHFGAHVAIWGDTAVVSTTEAEVDGQQSAGAAYIYVRKGTEWTEQAKLVSPEPTSYGWFGISLAIDAETIAIGAIDDVSIYGSAGSVYMFTRPQEQWTLHSRLIAGDHDFGDSFGCAIAIEGDTIVVGAQRQDWPGATEAGSAYVFARQDDVWIEQAQVAASDLAKDDWFGSAVAVGRGSAVVGALLDDTLQGEDAGSAYFFDLNCEPPCYGDFDDNGLLDLFDFLAFVNSFNSADPAADCAVDGVLDLFDFLCFVNYFNEGC